MKRYEKYRRKLGKVWKIQKKSKVNREKIGKIRKKSGWWWRQTFVRNVIMKIKWRGRGR